MAEFWLKMIIKKMYEIGVQVGKSKWKYKK